MNEDVDTKVSSPRVTTMRVVPVAGYDGMLLNLSGAHAPHFTRNVVILTDDADNTGVGEVPGGKAIRQVLEESRALVVGHPIASCNAVLNAMNLRFLDLDSQGRGQQTFDLSCRGCCLQRTLNMPLTMCGSQRDNPMTWGK
jgi:glucarate dehydratase